MSMTSWHNYGYGINTDKIDIPDEKNLKNCIESIPWLYDDLLDIIADKI